MFSWMAWAGLPGLTLGLTHCVGYDIWHGPRPTILEKGNRNT